MTDIDNRAFAAQFFNQLPEGASPVMCYFQGDPGNPPKYAWSGHPAGRRSVHFCRATEEMNTYICISSFTQSNGRYHRRKSDFAALHCLMLDDIGTGAGAKIAPDKLALKPTAMLETSPDNFQVYLKLSEPLTDSVKAEKLIKAMIYQGLDAKADPGMDGLTRVGRLPVGVNGKPRYGGWDVRLTEWNPKTAYTVEEIVEAFGLDLDAVHVSREYSRIPVIAGDDPYLEVLETLGLKPKKTEECIYSITCPWVERHSERAETGTYYYLGGGYKCNHGHCLNLNIHDLNQWLESKGSNTVELQRQLFTARGNTLLKQLLTNTENNQ